MNPSLIPETGGVRAGSDEHLGARRDRAGLPRSGRQYHRPQPLRPGLRPEPEILNLNPSKAEILDPHSKAEILILNSKAEIVHSKPGSRSKKPEILNPKRENRNMKPEDRTPDLSRRPRGWWQRFLQLQQICHDLRP